MSSLKHAPFFFIVLLSFAFAAITTVKRDTKVGYLLTTFPVQDEAIYMLLSNGNNPHSFQRLSIDGTEATEAILRSTVGKMGVRDSFVVPAQDGSKFWLIGTDLNVNSFGNNFNESTRFGSRAIVVWESSNLVDWSAPVLTPNLVNVSAGNVWAPEANWDPLVNAYVIVFASRYWPESDTNRTGPVPNNNLMYVTTNDFFTFSAAETYFSPGYPVIDATFLAHPEEGSNVWYRWVKSEIDFKIFQQKSTNGLLGMWENVGNAPDGERIEFASQYENNEGPLVFRDNLESNKFHLWIDENTLQSYIPATANTLNDMKAWTAESLDKFPKNIKHGRVLPLNQEQYDAILKKYKVVE